MINKANNLDLFTWFYLVSLKAVNQSINDPNWVIYPEQVKIEGERSYFCTNINLIICVQTEVNPNWIGAEEAAIDDDIVINFGERTKSKLKIGHYPPPSAPLDQVSFP